MISTKDFATKQLAFIFTGDGEKLTFSNDNIVVVAKDGTTKHRSSCYRLFAVFVCGHTSITSGLLQRADKFGFHIILMSPNLRPLKFILSGAQGNVLLRRKQYAYTDTGIATHIVSNKIENQVALLKQRRHRTLHQNELISRILQLKDELKKPNLTLQEIMGLEGVAAKWYFGMLFDKHGWQARRPRVKSDVINALLDMGYTMLFGFVTSLLSMFGFDLYVGVLHREFYHRHSLVCDLVEPFRCLVDEAILKALNLKQIKEEDFCVLQGQYLLSWQKRAPYVQIILKAILERKGEIFAYVQSYYRAFMREKPASEFPVFNIVEAR